MSKVQLKLKLNSKVPTKVYATNGKHYMLQPGSNTLNLEYNDYVSLTKALGIKTKDELHSKASEKYEDIQKPAESELDEPVQTKQDNYEDNTCTVDTCDSVAEDLHEDPVSVDDAQGSVAEDVQESVSHDYTEMSYTQLKAEYKKVTGKSCKLKKDEIIAFLQEHSSDVE